MDDVVRYVDTSERVIISDLLYYIGNKIGSTPVKSIVTTVNNFYTDEDYVFNEKKKLCKVTNEECKTRRTDNKRQINIEDICAIFVRRDSQNLFMPKFVSSDLNRIPMNEDGNPTLGQILAAISDLKRNTVTAEILASSLTNLKEELSTSPPPLAASKVASTSDSASASAPRLTPTAPIEEPVSINSTSNSILAPAPSPPSSVPLVVEDVPTASSAVEEDGAAEPGERFGDVRSSAWLEASRHRAEFAVSMSLTIFLDYVRGDSTCYVDGFRVRVLAIAFSWQRRGGFLRVICVCFRCNIVR